MVELYDVIVVGAGSAGAILASRLSEDPKLHVLVLEAGAGQPDDAMPNFDRLSGGTSAWPDPAISWSYKSIQQVKGHDQTSGQHLNDTTLVNLNALSFPDLDVFGQLGNEGWSWGEMQPYYQKLHHANAPKQIKQVDARHEEAVADGNADPCAISTVWDQTISSLGRESRGTIFSVDDSSSQHGTAEFDPFPAASRHTTAYLTEEVRNRSNLRIIHGAYVEKLLLQSGCPARVHTIRYSTADGRVLYTQAAREVILCAGVFNSPQILELSGVGPSEILHKHNIRVLVDLPGVGENLQDHAVVGVSHEARVPTLESLLYSKKLHAGFEQEREQGDGPLANKVYAFSYLSCVDGISEASKVELAAILDQHVSEAPVSRGLQKQFDIIRDIIEDPARASVQYVFSPVRLGPDQTPGSGSETVNRAKFLNLYASLSHPFSRGSCHISSADPSRSPVIGPRYFTHAADVEIEARHVQYIEMITDTKPLADLIKPGGRTIPDDLDLRDVGYAKSLIKTGFSTYHPSSTCSMMPREYGGVVDARGRVHGVQGLRVVDASIFPLIPRGNMQTSVYALAERAADIIREDLLRS